jgi:hypothetical protein
MDQRIRIRTKISWIRNTEAEWTTAKVVIKTFKLETAGRNGFDLSKVCNKTAPLQPVLRIREANKLRILPDLGLI